MTGLGGSFWRLFGSSATSNLADGVSRIVIPLVAAALTRDPVAISVIGALAYLPWLLFAVPGGALVDRIDRRVAMAIANTFRALVFAILGLSTVAGFVSLPLLYAVCLLFGIAEVIYDSAARAMLPAVLDRSRLEQGNSLMTAEETIGQGFLGAPVGSFLFAAAAAIPIFGSAAAFAIAAALILTVRGRFKPERTAQTTVRADIGEGLRWLWQHRFLRGLTVTSGLVGVTQAMPNAILVLFALQVLGLSSQAFGLLVVAAAVGALAGGLTAPALARRFGRGRCLVIVSVVSPLAIAGMGLVGSPWVAGSFLAVGSAAVTVWNVLSMSLRQAMIPPELFGRVLGSYRMVIWGAIPVGSLLGGALADGDQPRHRLRHRRRRQLVVAFWIWRLVARHRDEIDGAFADSGPADPVPAAPAGSALVVPPADPREVPEFP